MWVAADLPESRQKQTRQTATWSIYPADVLSPVLRPPSIISSLFTQLLSSSGSIAPASILASRFCRDPCRCLSCARMKRATLRSPRLGGYPILSVSRAYSTPSSELARELTSRSLPLAFDYLHTQPSHLLGLTLRDLLPHPHSRRRGESDAVLPSVKSAIPLPAGHHLVYFPPQVPLSQLLPDGTDTLHSPGEPFHRRLWAGGRVRFPTRGGLVLDGSRAACIETIRDMVSRGRPGEEKVMVRIERRIGLVQESEQEPDIRARLWRENEEDSGQSAIIEHRDLVFMREKSPEEATTQKRQRIVKCAHDQPIGST